MLGVLWFLAMHGAIVSYVVLAGTATLGLGIVQIVRRHRDDARNGAEVSLRSVALDGPRPGPISIRGTIGEVRDGGYTLECAGERVRVEGAPRIVLGTRARWPWRAPARVDNVVAGDEVIARGVMSEAVEGNPNASHRLAARAWQLAPSVDVDRVELCATRPAICPRGLAPWRTGAILVAFGASLWFPLRAIGTGLLSVSAQKPRSNDGLAKILVGALIPGATERAMNTAFYFLDVHAPRTVESSDRRLALAARDGCETEIRGDIYEERYEAAIARAAECGTPAAAIEAQLSLGDYDAAMKLVSDPSIAKEEHATYDRGLAAIGAGKWAEAAAIADQRAADNERGRFKMSGTPARCAAVLFRARAGTDPSGAELDRCSDVGALLRHPDERADALRRYPEWRDVVWSYDGMISDKELGPDVIQAETFERVLLAPYALQKDDSPANRTWMVQYELVRGDLAAARALLTKLGDGKTAFELATLVALRGGTELPARPDDIKAEWDELAAPRAFAREGTGDPAALVDGNQITCTDLAVAALHAAVLGDGDPLAELVERCDAHSQDLLLASLARTKSKRLAEAILMPVRSIGFFKVYPAGHARAAAYARDVARMVGDRATADRMQGIVERQLKVLGDRDRLEALMLWAKS